MLYLGSDNYEGRAARLYRCPEAIRSDMRDIRNKIGDLGERLNFARLIDGLLADAASGDFDSFIVELDALLLEARETFDVLTELNSTLMLLADELEEAGRAVR